MRATATVGEILAKRRGRGRITAALLFFLAACDDDGLRRSPMPSRTTTQAPTATTPAEPSRTPTAQPATHTPTATITLTRPPSPTPSETPSSTPSATVSPTASPTPSTGPESCDDPVVRAREPLCELDYAPFPCEIFGQEQCLFPYPSFAFLRIDPSTRTGLRLEYPREAMPANAAGVHIDPTEWNRLDGFSPDTPILVLFQQGVDLAASGAASIDDVARSLEPDSPTVIYDTQTGRRVAHFVELDANASVSATRALVLRPAVRLRNQGLYAVALRGLVDADGAAIEAPRAFVILRDGLATPVRAIERRRARFEGILGVLEEEGVERENLILAWDFVTAGTPSLTGRAVAVRDQGIAANGAGAPPFEVTKVEEDVNERIFRRVSGRFEVPLFLDSATPPAFLNLDAAGVPRQNGAALAPFTVTIPQSAVAAGTAAARLLLYGHDLHDDAASALAAPGVEGFADRFGVVLAATDWIGFSSEDLGVLDAVAADLSLFPALPDRLQQAMLNLILLERLVTAPDGIRSHPSLLRDGVPLIAPEELDFYGAGWGALAGVPYMALTQDVIRGALVAGTANHGLILERSRAFAPLVTSIAAAYTREIDRPLVLALLQQLWDRADAAAYLPHLFVDPLPDTPPKRLLFQVALHDSRMPALGAEVAARSLELRSVAPSVVPLFQIRDRAAPFEGSGLALYDLNGVAAPSTNTAPLADNGVHDALLRLDAAERQVDAFLRDGGQVETFCDGPCFFRDVPGVVQR